MKTFQPPDQTNPIVQASAEVFESLRKNPLINGILIENIAIRGDGSDNVIKHTLGRNYTGILVTKVNALTRIASDQRGNRDLSRYVHMQSDVDCTVSIWVF